MDIRFPIPAAPPLRVVATAFVLGCVGGLTLPKASLAIAVALVLCAGLNLRLRRRRGERRALLLAVAASALLTATLRSAAAPPPPAPSGFRETPVVLTGVVESAPRVARDAAGGRSAVLRLALDDAGQQARVRIRLARGQRLPDVMPGDRLRVSGRATAPRPASNPGQQDRREALRRTGIVLHVAVPTTGAVRVSRSGTKRALHRVRCAGARLRHVLLARLAGAVGGRRRTVAVLSALLVGDRSLLDDDVESRFRHAGAAHLLAVSGLHVVLLVGVVAAALEGARRRLCPGRRGRAGALLVTLAFVVAYAVACGLATPVVRASLFVGIALTARWTGRRTRTPDHLAAAAAVVAAADPAQVLAPGFQLSFAAVLGLATLTPRFREALFATWDLIARFPEALPPWRRRLHAWLAAGASASLAAATATAPVSAAVFGELHPAAPLSNLLAVPLVAVLLPAAAAAAILGPVAEPLAGPLLELAVAMLTTLLGGVAELPGATLVVGEPPVWALVASVTVLATVAASRPWRRPHLIAPALAWALLAAPSLAASAAAPPRPPEIVALDVGHGVSVLLRGGHGGAVLYDAGGRLPGTAERIVLPALRALGVRRLAAVAISHEDVDHCGAVPELLQELPVGALLVPPGFGGGPAGRRVLRACERRAVPVLHLGRGDTWDLRDVRMRALHPEARTPGPAENEGSLVLHVTLLGASGKRLDALLPGDLEGTTLDALARDATLPPIDVLLLPHHGRGDPEPQVRLARRCGAAHLIASSPAAAPTEVPGAHVTGRDGAVSVTPGRGAVRLLR